MFILSDDTRPHKATVPERGTRMKILIADDEKLTREGIIKNVSWENFGITRILQADNGVQALEIIKRVRPEFVLTDIRMPVMDGIEMAQEIQRICPDCAVIFMSGYSDKEYLKAAIRLGIVQYVEKPISIKEIEEALGASTVRLEELRQAKRSENDQTKKEEARLAAALLTRDAAHEDGTRRLAEALGISPGRKNLFNTMVIEFADGKRDAVQERLEQLLAGFDAFLSSTGRRMLYVYKGDRYLILHIYHNREDSNRILSRCTAFWQEHLSGHCHFFIAIGKSVRGLTHVCKSYADARTLLLRAFFHEEGAVLTDPGEPAEAVILGDHLGAWQEALAKGAYPACLEVAERLYRELKGAKHLLPGQAKDIYYRYFIQMENIIERDFAVSRVPVKESDTIWGSIDGCYTLSALHELLMDRLLAIMEAAKHEVRDSSVISMIKDFVRKNCAAPNLSVKDIGAYMHLSAGYVCTIFKSATGQTLNQYITQYRMERAKELLGDVRIRIGDISAAVGYGDSSYFGKLFRRTVGLSPSDYREKVTQHAENKEDHFVF